MDFFKIRDTTTKKGVREIFPEFIVGRSKDLMIRGKSFYAIWDKEAGLWSTDEYDVQRLVDEELFDFRKKIESEDTIMVKSMKDFSSRSWTNFKTYVNQVADNAKQLDEKLTFQNTEVKKSDYVSKRLPYSLEDGDCPAFKELIGTLYEQEEREKIEWAIGAIISGDARTIQKFLVFYGEAGTGKSTILNIIQKLFDGYYLAFDAKALTSASNAFSTEMFKMNPLVAIQHDGDLSKIEDNTKLNSIVSHEEMLINEKHKPTYTAKMNCFLLMATNRPVKITDAKSGIIRRLIDVNPSNRKIPPKHYHALMAQIDFELGAIAKYCLDTYLKLGKNYYAGYRPLSMIYKTDVFFNFVEDSYFVFKEQSGVSLKAAFAMYKEYCDNSGSEFKLPLYKFREELKNYFRNFEDVARVDGKQIRSYFSGFLLEKFQQTEKLKEEKPIPLVLDQTESLLDDILADCPAQYATADETPAHKWENILTKLKDISTTKLHYVRPPENHIVIDFDLKDENGNKSVEKNLEAASKFPPTYAEFSKGGAGVHLHYIFTGDAKKLKNLYSEGIEIKVFAGKASLRRRLSKCNNIPIAEISYGLPMKEEKVVNLKTVQSEQGLRKLIEKNLRKEIHPGTKPSIDFIWQILEDAYNSGLHYDVRDMRNAIMIFATGSTNHGAYCVKMADRMKYASEDHSPSISEEDPRLMFFDVEVFPNLFVIVTKFENQPCERYINPSPSDVEYILKHRLVGFNCRRYDNHILYAALIGYSNEQLYNLSQKIINGSKNAMFGEAYNISYTDVYDFSNKKQSLKKFEIELDIHHQELGLPWDRPVPEDQWTEVAEYCDNDVIATEAVFHARSEDWVARQILAELSGLSVNDTTNSHTARIIFGSDRKPQSQFVYTDLSEMFPGYKFDNGISTYRGEEVGEGGYIYAEPGMYFNVTLLDVTSMHPTSIENLNLFGDIYTKNFSDIKRARIAIKHRDLETAKTLFSGRLVPHLEDESKLDGLAFALKIVINSVYGMTSAKFDNPFRDPRNVDNIVAKRGALFMIDLKHAVQEKGFTVAHIKTDSIKIPGATPEIIQFVMDFGKKYGYTFEHEATYDRMCLVNDAVYIARFKGGKKDGQWSATGAQFAEPYVFKTLFSKEPVNFTDLRQTKTVTSAMYLAYDEVGEMKYHFVGRAGSFVPVTDDVNGGILLREKDGKYYAVGGTKGYRWMESEVVQELNYNDFIDMRYYEKLADDAKENISQFGDFNMFAYGEPVKLAIEDPSDQYPPWIPPCGKEDISACDLCEYYSQTDTGKPACKLGYTIYE